MTNNDQSVGDYSRSTQPGDSLPDPPGFLRILSDCLLFNSYSPVREVAITAALATLAGVCGRAFRTHTGKDLALYLLLVARSGIGKDAIHEGIPKLVGLSEVRGAERFIKIENFVSGQALHRTLLVEPGFLNVQGEMGRKLKRMANPTDAPMQEFRTVLTNAFAKEFLEGKAHARAENSIPGVQFPALSFLGETTPSTFLESLTPDMMEDGFLSRFLTINYEGGKPNPQHERHLVLEPRELEHWRALVAFCTTFQGSINTPSPRKVGFKDFASSERLFEFELSCTADLNATEDEFERQLLSRAPLKVMKIASLLAVADNFNAPLIDLGHAVWAITVVRADMNTFRRKLASGEVGSGDHNRELIVLKLLRAFVFNGPGNYKMPINFRQDGQAQDPSALYVPRHFVQTRTANLAAFKNHRLGANAALDQTLRSLVENGFIREVDKRTALEKLQFFGRCFQVLSRVLDS